MNKRQTTTLWVGILVLVAVGASALILRDLPNRERRQLEDGRNLSPADLSKVTLEPMEIWSVVGTPHLKCRLYNGTNRPLVEAQVTLYVRRDEDQFRSRVSVRKRDMFDVIVDADKWRNAKSMPSAESAREYKQELNRIGPVPPNSWYEGNIDLSNCPSEVTYTPDDMEPAHWRVILNVVKWEKQKESGLCAVAANWRYLAFPAATVVLIVGGLIFTLKDRVPKAVSEANARVKAALQGIVVTEIGQQSARPYEGASISPPLPKVSASAVACAGTSRTTCDPLTVSAKSTSQAERWPWRRAARWTYTWWQWMGVVFVLGGLSTLSGGLTTFADIMAINRQLSSLVALMMWTSLLIQASIIVAFAFAYRKMFYDPTEGGKIIIYGFIASAGLGIAKIFFGMFVLDSGSILARSTQVQGWIILALGLLFARLAQPLTYLRFTQLARLLDRLYRSGVPKSFMKKYNHGNLPVRGTYAIGPDEPRESMSLIKLYRAVAVGKVVLPDKVEYGG